MLNSEEALKRLSDMELAIQLSSQHITDATRQFEQVERAIDEIFQRLANLERKTACLSDQPLRKNCPECTKIVNTTGLTCPHCGFRLPL